jgi:hypothetical protein
MGIGGFLMVSAASVFLWCLCGREGFKRDPDFGF